MVLDAGMMSFASIFGGFGATVYSFTPLDAQNKPMKDWGDWEKVDQLYGDPSVFCPEHLDQANELRKKVAEEKRKKEAERAGTNETQAG
jgi:hypothetical protein